MSTNRNSEQWQMVESFPGYAVSNRGRVLSLPRYIEQSSLHGGIPCHKGPKFLCPRIVGAGYLQVVLYRDGKRFAKYVHVLVAEAFCAKVSGASEVNHEDFDKANNHASNLCWVDRLSNMRHARSGGAYAGGPSISRKAKRNVIRERITK